MLYETWPQLVWMMLIVVGLIGSLYNHGKPKVENFWVTLLSISIGVIILYYGGFFDVLLK